jgi:hypothetical protein
MEASIRLVKIPVADAATLRLNLTLQVYLTFRMAFWDVPTEVQMPSNGHSQDPMKDPLKTLPNTTATTAPLHQSSAPTGEPSKHFAGFMQWLSPHYAPSNPQQWNQEGMNLAALPGSCAHPTLLFYVFGPCAQHIGKLVRTTPQADLTAALSAFFEPYLSRLPNYEASSPDCRPVEALATAWVNDELAGNGSYSNFPIGLQEGDKDIECMREGEPERGLWFAGEHTAPFVALGTVTGAWWSGEGVAKRLSKLYGMDSDNGMAE